MHIHISALTKQSHSQMLRESSTQFPSCQNLALQIQFIHPCNPCTWPPAIPHAQGAIFFHNLHRIRVENYSKDNKNVEGYSEIKPTHNDLFKCSSSTIYCIFFILQQIELYFVKIQCIYVIVEVYICFASTVMMYSSTKLVKFSSLPQ